MIRPVTPSDLWMLRRKPRNLVLLYSEALLAQPHRPSWHSLRCLIDGNGVDGATLMYHDRNIAGVVQSIARTGQQAHDVIMLATYDGKSGSPTDPDVWFRLLEALCAHLGQRRIQRLYATLAQRHEDVRVLFRQLGFVNYTHQIALRLDGPDWNHGTSLASMRAQARWWRDTWAIHRLYGTITPPSVQHAEARGARDWVLPLARGLRRPRQRAWVLGADDDLTAYLHLTSGGTANVFTLLLRPEARDITTDILRFGLTQISDTLPVYLLLREYQRDLLAPAADLGFQPIGEQALLCKHMAVEVRRSILKPALERASDVRTPIPTISSHKRMTD